jgi:hypothetical protein
MSFDAESYTWTLQLSETNHGRLQAVHFLIGASKRSALANKILDIYLFDQPREVPPDGFMPIKESRRGLFLKVTGETAAEINRRAKARDVGSYTVALYTLEYGLDDLASVEPAIDKLLEIREQHSQTNII